MSLRGRRLILCGKQLLAHPASRRYFLHGLALFLLLATVIIQFAPPNALLASAQTQNHTVPTVNETCNRAYYSNDGNPFQLCPGPFPVGGNCVWWAWEQWHLLGYDLPLNWGNAADWVVDAERSGFSVGTVPRVSSIAVFPRADGVWAFGPEGHVAFVTSVSNDGSTFNVTYQNYGDPTPMYIGQNYNVSIINLPNFQAGELRFIYFPTNIDPSRFAKLPGVGNVDPATIAQANTSNQPKAAGAATSYTMTTNRLALGSSQGSSEQEFNADFTGTGLSNLLLYNRGQGRLDVLKLYPSPLSARAMHRIPGYYQDGDGLPSPQMVSLGDAITPAGKWGASLDVHVGNFSGSKAAEILLYDRVAGTIQILSLNPDLSIKKHVVLSGIGSGWELYSGRFDGQRSSLFMYKRYAQADPNASSNNSSASDSSSNTTGTVPGSTSTLPATNTPGATSTHTPTSKPTVTPTSTPKPCGTAAAVKSATCPTPTPITSPTTTPTSTPTTTPTSTPTTTPTTTPTPTASPAPTPTTVPTTTATATQQATTVPTATATTVGIPDIRQQPPDVTHTDTLQEGGDLSGASLQDWEKQGRTANIMVMSFKPDLSIRSQQQYTLWHANWEVYVGAFAGPQTDGIFLYDRHAGEGRLLDFNSNMQVIHFQQLHNLDGNWVVYSGDFIGAGRAQLLLYEPASGSAKMMTLKSDLSVDKQQDYVNWGTNMVLYIGHFGMPTLSVMLYDPQGAQSTFMAFDTLLNVAHQYTVKSWDLQWEILVGSFLDHTRCATAGNCATGDDILVLNRQTGQLEQYVFSFGRKFQVFDNRIQSFQRAGVASDYQMSSVDTTSFSLLTTLDTSIRDEELY